ncbi:MAG TPA: hypothetical protein VLB74_12285, partial [Flavobacterium sp.]|nr:hypothetical protein [Flavobacterium sp.]
MKNSKKVNVEVAARTVWLSDIQQRLTIMARALTGNPIEIFPAEREGGYKNNNFFLPISFAEFPTAEENLMFYHFRVLFLSIQQGLNLNWTSTDNEPSLELSQQRALESSEEILPVLFKLYSIDAAFLTFAKNHFIQKADAKKAPDFSWLFGKWMKNEVVAESENELQNFSD